MRQTTGYAISLRIKDGADRLGRQRYFNTSCWSDRQEQPGYYLRLVGFTEPAQVIGCDRTKRSPNDFQAVKEQPLL